ncbi:hypothetical protein MSAN_00677300 [Mycena sanguinolenta]|uniref:Uncharacterized protein n=1 Tax=Mycena sanguinolenta TaxID=230812 RepID=A0A8H6Z4Z8_9AGAR|nr:hypothetical protein MSAN_00677300 [Mycena sanguinolenta]
MSSIPEASLSILTSNSTATPWGLISIGIVGGIVYYASPMRLTRVLVATIADTEKIYLTAVENGVLCPSADMETAQRLALLQIEVSTIRETSLRTSLSLVSALYDTFNIRRTVAILRCLGEVRVLGTSMEILSETRLREVDSRPHSHRTCISLRRRDAPSRA